MPESRRRSVITSLTNIVSRFQEPIGEGGVVDRHVKREKYP